MFIKTRIGLYAVLILLSAIFIFPQAVEAGNRTFPSGSYVIPMDSCWQPNNDPAAVPNAGTNCDTDKNDKSVFQAYGMVYAILDRGDDPDNCINNDGSTPFQKKVLGYCKPIKVYWMIDKNKTTPHDPDLIISGATTPIADVYNSLAITTTGSENPVNYVGGPFVIDANDITPQEMQLFMDAYPEAKIHKVNVEFSGNVDKILIGKPPKVAVLSEGAVQVLQDYLRASGLFSWENYVFEQVNARDVIAGCLEDPIPATCKARRPDITSTFQLMWAPHWIVESGWTDGNPTLAEQNEVISAIRTFLEKGNAGFYECASIESLEGSQDSKGPRAGNEYDQPNDPSNPNVGGLLVGSNVNPPRLDANGGCSDTKGCNVAINDPLDSYLKFEDSPFWLMQCGGWNYEATGGHVHNMRPNDTTGFYYLTTKKTDDPNTSVDDRYIGSQLKRFIHDDYDEVDYAPSSPYYVYDYLVGGRINGSPTQGYVVYFPGHKYIKCQNSGTFDVPERVVNLQFDTPLDPNSIISLELIHPYCTPGSCPVASFDIAAGHGTTNVDSYAYVDMDSAVYDPATNTLQNVIIGNKTAGNLSVLDLVTTFDTDRNGAPVNQGPPPVLLTNIEDVTDPATPFSVCTPNSPSPASCSGAGITTNDITFNFSGPDLLADPTGSIVRIEIIHGSCTEGIDCPMVEYDVSTGTQVNSRPDTSNKIFLDASTAVYSYDPATQTGALTNVKLGNIDATCSDVTITDIAVDFPDNTATTLLTSIDNATTGGNICTPNTSSQARCTSSGGGVVPPPPAGTCPEAIYDINAKTGISADDGIIKLDMSKSGFDGKGKKLQDITIENIGCDNMTITDLYLEFPDGNATLDLFKKFKQDKTTLCDPNPDIDNSPATCSFTQNIGATGSKKNKYKFEFANPHNNSGVIKFQIGYTCDDGSSCTIPGGGGGGGGGVSWSYVLPSGLSCGGFNYVLGPFTSTCAIDWKSSNTCGIKYVLNTLLALRFQLTSNEFTKTQPIVKDEVVEKDASTGEPTVIKNVIYKASFDYPIYRGHLKKIGRLIDIPNGTVGSPAVIWDAADHIPDAGASMFPSGPSKTLSNRYIFTNLPGLTTTVNFDPNHASTLMTYLGEPTADDAKVLINTVRGRKDASKADAHGSSCDYTPDGIPDINGCGEDTKKLWAIEHSTPALMTDSRLVAPADEGSTTTDGHRDMVIFAGADDGMLHAFHAGSWNSASGIYDNGTGSEIWAFIPGSLLSSLKDQPFHPDPTDYTTFEPAVSVDGSPALGDFLVKNDGTNCSISTEYCWRTYLVGTADVRNSASSTVPNGAGILFALDVTNPYTPNVLWEGHYADKTATKCEGDQKNCNMGQSKGTAIGSVFVGDKLKTLVFLTSNWIEKKKPSNWNYDCTANPTDPACVAGVSAYAIELVCKDNSGNDCSGNVVWETRLPYTGDAVNITDVPAIPALMDIDDNGTVDYVVFGDMQGRLWALNAVTGKSIAGQDNSGLEKPVFEVPDVTCDANGCTAGTTPQGAQEPIGAAVSTSSNLVVFGTGGTDFASNTKKYHVFGVRILTSPVNGKYAIIYEAVDPGTNNPRQFIYETDPGEKIWSKPVIFSKSRVMVVSAKDFYSRKKKTDVSQLQSTGRIGLLNLKTAESTVLQGSGGTEWAEGGFVGGIDADSNHAYVISLRSGSKGGAATGGNAPFEGIYEIGSTTAASFAPNPNRDNPFDVLWWRKL